ncbi:MAG TPA: peptide deformylase [Burkholderiales bacterium]|jgi:peptide deformylase|nr:peptide deformylase [Burkholderiales bacterium]
MAILKILHYPDERLHTVAKAVDTVDGSIRKLVADMAETMYAAPGIGLAATQVDVHRRVIVIDTSDTRDDLRVFINPQIVDSGGSAEFEEGCLSVPGIFDKVQRAEWIKVQALDGNGHPFTLEADGILGDCIQHEIDHLAGRVFVEHLSRLKQQRILAKLRKQSRKVM